MPVFYRICFVLRKKSWYMRLLIIFLSFALLEVPVSYLIAHGADRSIASALFFSGMLAALLFKWNRAFIVQCCLLMLHILIVIGIRSINYPSWAVIANATCVNFFLIWTIGCLRQGWELAEEATEKQKELAVMKDQFIANVSHEMRSPLTGAIGSLDLLKEWGTRLDEEEQEIFLNQAIYACDELQRIADNILDALRCDNGDVSPPWIQEFNLSIIVLRVLRHVDSVGHPIHIDIPAGITASGDSQQVGQVVRNLLSNCFKYSPKGAPVSVRVWYDDVFSYVSVRDRGPGIAPDQIPLVFQKFSRLPRDLAGSVRGIGLGLYICRRFIENMYGHIWVESTGVEGEGSNFCFTLPCMPKTPYRLKVSKRKERRKI